MPVDTDKRSAWDDPLAGREKNSQSTWNELWHRETGGGQHESWRQYPEQYARIRWLLKYTMAVTQSGPDKAPTIVDLGCGEGVLLSRIRADLKDQVPGAHYVGRDISDVAAEIARGKGLDVRAVDLVDAGPDDLPPGDVLVCTEVLEHLPMPTVEKILSYSKGFNKAFFMVPNYCLGPEHEAQHLRKWSAKEFLELLRRYWTGAARVEVFYDPEIFYTRGHRGYLLGVCGYQKGATLSMTMPVKDEAADVERVLASFRGAADEIVIGVDDLSSDATEEICKLYADKIFKFTWAKDFSAARNACIRECTCDWIFMTEGHEHLHRGQQWLLQIDETPPHIDVLHVRREAKTNIWYFPWLFRRKLNAEGEPVIRFQNACHNALVYDEKHSGQAPQISTWHERAIERSEIRRQQRNTINKQEYLRRIRTEHNVRDMYYLASEYRDERCPTCEGRSRVMVDDDLKPCPDCVYTEPGKRPIATGIRPFALRQSLYWFDRFIATAPRTPMCYQARLALAATWKRLGQPSKAVEVLLAATGDDPTRIEHWYMLGQLFEEQDRLDLALRFYEYASHGIDRPPASGLFIEKAMYTYGPALALARTYANFGMLEEGLVWALRVPDLLPEWCAPDLRESALQLIEDIKTARAQKEADPNEVSPGMFL